MCILNGWSRIRESKTYLFRQHLPNLFISPIVRASIRKEARDAVEVAGIVGFRLTGHLAFHYTL